MEASVKEQLMNIHGQLSSLIGNPLLQKVSVRPGGGSPGHPDSGVCLLANDILSREDFLSALNKIDRWVGYIIEVMETNP